MLILALAVAVVAAGRGMWSPCGLSMLSSLNPVSETARGHRFGLTACWYVAGAVLGGAVLGLGCAVGAGLVALAPFELSWLWLPALLGGLVAAGSDSTLTRFALPDHPRQVDVRWLGRYRRWIYAGGFGVQIGTGFATYIMSATVYLTALLAVLTARPAAAFGVGLAFGVVRGLGVLATAGVRDPAGLRRLLATVDRYGPASLHVTTAAALTAALVSAAVLLRLLPGPAPTVLALLAAGLGAGAAVTGLRIRHRPRATSGTSPA